MRAELADLLAAFRTSFTLLFTALLRLLPRKGLVLYVQGSTRSVAARDRTSGMRDSTRGAPFDVDLIEAGWTRAEARSAVAKWFRIVSRGNLAVDLVSCQNDQIALGVLDALQDVAAETGRQELGRIPVCGCDGTGHDDLWLIHPCLHD